MTELDEVAEGMLGDYLYFLCDLPSDKLLAGKFVDQNMDDGPDIRYTVALKLHNLATQHYQENQMTKQPTENEIQADLITYKALANRYRMALQAIHIAAMDQNTRDIANEALEGELA